MTVKKEKETENEDYLLKYLKVQSSQYCKVKHTIKAIHRRSVKCIGSNKLFNKGRVIDEKPSFKNVILEQYCIIVLSKDLLR